MTQTINLKAGATETEIRSAFYQLNQTGGTLVFAKDQDITLTKTLSLTIGANNVTIDLNGSTLHQCQATSALIVSGVEGAMTSVKLGLDAAKNTTVTYDKLPTGLTVGSYLKVTADNKLPGDHVDAQDAGKVTLVGQAGKIIAINGNTVVLEGQIVEQDQYKANVRASVYSEGQFTLKNGTIDGPGSSNYSGLVQLRSLNEPVVEDLKVSDADAGIKVVNSVHAYLKDIVANNVGVGVQSSTSLNTTIDGMFAENGLHAVMVHGIGTTPNASSAAAYGADVGLVGKNIVAYDQERAAFDFHSESRDGTYTDVLAFNSRMFGDLRGIGNTFENSAGAGNSYGVQFFEYGDGDGRNATVDNLVLRETANYTFIVSGKPVDNTITNSNFESYGVGYKLASSVATMVNSTLTTGILTDNDLLVGTKGADKLLGGKGADVILGGEGNDYIWGGAGIDTLTGGIGNDRFAYHALNEGADIITDFKAGVNGDVIDLSVLGARLGWDGDAFLADGKVRAVQSGANTLVQVKDGSTWTSLATLLNVKASAFTEYNVQSELSDVEAWKGPVTTETVAAKTTVVETVVKAPVAAPVASTVVADSSTKAPTTVAKFAAEVSGTSGADWFKADGGSTLFKGSAGNDGYVIDHLADRVFGETASGGTDTINASVNVNLNDHAFVENLRLAEGTMPLKATGNALANLMTGNAGANVIAGGLGNDSLYGKGGADIFHFAEMGAANKDSIWDFDRDDHMSLSKSVFANLDANGDGVLDAGSFTVVSKAGAGAIGTKAQVIFNSATGIVSYDADGTGSKAAQDIAFIGTAAKGFFTADDVLLV